MAKIRSRVPLGSLDNMASKVRDQKAASKSKSVELKDQKFTKASSDSDASDSSSSDSSGSDSDNSADDDDLDVEAARNKFNAKQASKRKVSEKEKPNSKSTKPTSTKSSQAATTSPDDSDSDSDSDESQVDPSKDVAVRTVQKDLAENKNDSDGASSSSDEAESGSESEAEEAEQGEEGGSESDSSDAASEIGSDPGNDSDDEGGSVMEIDGETAVSKPNGQSAVEGSGSQTSRGSRPAWLENSNFVFRKASSDNPAKEISDFLNKTNTVGKQVWYLTAPESLPITVMRDVEIDLNKAGTGDAILQHKGDEYGALPDLRESKVIHEQIQVIIPSPAGDEYANSSRSVDSTVHIRQIAKVGPDGALSSTATDEYTPVPKPIRQQPPNLRTRFNPIGVPTPTLPQIQSLKAHPGSAAETREDDESESDSDQDMTEAPSTPTRSKGSNDVNGILKRKLPIQSSEKSAKRTKTSNTPKASSAKQTAIQPPARGLATNGTPSKASSASAEDTAKKAKKGKEKKDKPKSSLPPSKATPVPIPTIPGMRR